jgi:putative oxidoreductase
MAVKTYERPMFRESHAVELRLSGWLAAHSIAVLRMTLGLVFLGFGVLKFFPGMSPAEPLAAQTLAILSFGLVPVRIALLMVAALETAIGLSLLTGRWLRVGLVLLGLELVGILSPLVLLPGEMFRGVLYEPTLVGQYVLKDVIVAAAGLVLAAQALGAQLVVAPRRSDLAPATAERTSSVLTSEPPQVIAQPGISGV